MTSAADIKHQIKLKDELLQQLRQQLAEKDRTIHTLQCELDLIRTGLYVQKTVKRERGIGISAEPQAAKSPSQAQHVTFQRHSKSQKTRELLQAALQENDFLKHLEPSQIQQIASGMQPVEFRKDHVIIKEGDTGNTAYIIEDGRVEVSKQGVKMTELTRQGVFGELAMLYNCTRTATVKALMECRLWAIDRSEYQTILTCSAIVVHQQYVDFLKRITALKDKSEEKLNKIADLLEEVHYDFGEQIISKGSKGDTFYIISKGEVKVTDFKPGSKETVVLKSGDCFGEKALESEEDRNANVFACSPEGVDCLVLERDAYRQLIGKISVAADVSKVTAGMKEVSIPSSKPSHGIDAALVSVKLTDFKILATLGVGGFGRVELVQLTSDPKRTFALKQMKKKYIVDTHQQDHVMNEKNILLESRSDFIVRLYRTFRDSKYIYLLSEACLGGEMWTLLRDKGPFTDSQTRFYVACVIEGFSYLHSRFIVYRDLKPENLLLDLTGYVKLVDFGFAKCIGSKGQKTWTFCGTPEYVAPEVILNRGHDFAADIWSLGILVYELLNGSPPFSGSDHMKTYNMILKGIETVEFSKRIGKNAKHLVKKLCRESPIERLGYGVKGIKELQKHKWFDGFSWDGLRKRSLKAPLIPIVKNTSDSSNFDKFPPDTDQSPPDDDSGWDKDF